MEALSEQAHAFVHEGAEDARGEEAAAVVDHDWRLIDLHDVVKGLGEGFVIGLLALDDLDQRHFVHGEKKCRPMNFAGLADDFASCV